VKYEVIASQQRSKALSRVRQCKLLEVTRSAFYKHGDSRPTKRMLVDGLIAPKIRELFEGSDETYGVPMIRQGLATVGIHVGKARVSRLMWTMGLVTKGRRRVTRRVAIEYETGRENKLGRNFSPGAPGRRWCADLTYLSSKEGVCYLAAVEDVGTRAIVGWAWGTRRDESLSISALKMALSRRSFTGELIHHADQGGQYWSADYQARLEKAGITKSCSGRGACADNALIESFFGTLKSQCRVLRERPATREAAALGAIDWIETWYNRRRMHSSLGYRTPLEYEKMQMNQLRT
jgi:putative transposase